MTSSTANVVICGAGMAGITAAYDLAVRRGVRDIILVDERPPLSLTSDKGNEGYRNWWPGPDDTMVRFMNRSIDLLEELAIETDNAFQINRRGYVFLTATPNHIPTMSHLATQLSKLGAGPVRYYPGDPSPYIPSPAEGFRKLPTGADLVLDGQMIREELPFVAKDVVAMTHVRRAGWLNTRRLGHLLLERAQAQGLRLVQDRVVQVSLAGGRIQTIHLQSGDQISTRTFVIAAGPMLKQVGALLGLEIPVETELHGKLAFKDHLRIVPADAPYLIWYNSVYLPWTDTERQTLMANEETRWLLNEFPATTHFRIRPPRDVNNSLVLGMWSYKIEARTPIWPPPFDPNLAEVLLRGLARMIPGLSAYFEQGRDGHVDGGYYCKTSDNRPLIGPLPPEGAYVIGALSGYGIMASQAAAELLAAHVTGADLPDYAASFQLERYEDPAYLSLLAQGDNSSGQL